MNFAEPYVHKPLTIIEWLNLIGGTAYPLTLIAVLLTGWTVRLFLRTPSGNQIIAFTMAAFLPTLIGLLGFAAGWRALVNINGKSAHEPWTVFGGSMHIVLSPMIGMAESILFLSLAVIIILQDAARKSDQLLAFPASDAEQNAAEQPATAPQSKPK